MTRPAVLLACLCAVAACDPPTVNAPAETGGGTFSVAYTYPGDKATAVPSDAPVVIVFDADIDKSGLEGNVVVEKMVSGKGTAVKGSMSYDSAEFQVTVTPPSGRWEAASEYRVTVKAALKSKDGQKTLDKDLVFSFATQ